MLLLILASFLPRETNALSDRVDVCELNRVHDECGRECLVQIVWWNWSRWDGAYRVVAWRLISVTGHPRLEGNRWVTRWWDSKSDSFRRVESRVFRNTRTMYDPETNDRTVLPEDKRRGLTTR